MKYSPIIGVSVPEKNWVPSPTYILRRAAILDILNGFSPGRVLEIGCGSGALLVDLVNRGFEVVGIELSEAAILLSRHITKTFHDIRIMPDFKGLNKSEFDFLFSFEVLEHIEDDVAALSFWSNFLKPGGRLLFSVPAHRKKWNATDIMAGHFRRYDSNDIKHLLEKTGFVPERIQTYGWPISIINEVLRKIYLNWDLKKKGIEIDKIPIGNTRMTKQSGIDRLMVTKLFRLYGSDIGARFFALSTTLQKPFFKSHLGISFLTLAYKNT